MDKGVVAQGVVARYGVVAGKRTELTGTQERTEQVGSHITPHNRCNHTHIQQLKSESSRYSLVGTDKSNP